MDILGLGDSVQLNLGSLVRGQRSELGVPCLSQQPPGQFLHTELWEWLGFSSSPQGSEWN